MHVLEEGHRGPYKMRLKACRDQPLKAYLEGNGVKLIEGAYMGSSRLWGSL